MDLSANALVTLNDFKTFLGITDNTKDELLKMLINFSSDYIETETGRTFKSTSYTNEEYDGTGTEELRLKNFPILSFTKLEVNNNYDNSDSWDSWSEINANNYWVDKENGIITRTNDFLDFEEGMNNEEALSEIRFYKGKFKYRATYVAGFDTIPYDIQFACMILAEEMYKNRGNTNGIRSESLGDHSITYKTIAEMQNPMIDRVLSKYRDIPLAD